MRSDHVLLLCFMTSLFLHLSLSLGFDRLILFPRAPHAGSKEAALKLIYYQTAKREAPSGAQPGRGAGVSQSAVPPLSAQGMRVRQEARRTEHKSPASGADHRAPGKTTEGRAAARSEDKRHGETPEPENPVENLDLRDERVSAYFYDYYTLLSRTIQEQSFYPPSALARAETGVAEVFFVLARDGRVKRVQLSRSSGARLLDSSALETVRQSSPLPPIPSVFEVDELRLRVPIRYEASSYSS